MHLINYVNQFLSCWKLIFRVWDEHEVGELLVYYKKAAEFIGIFIGGHKIVCLLRHDQLFLHEIVQERSKNVPVQVKFVGVYEHGAQRNFFPGENENGIIGDLPL